MLRYLQLHWICVDGENEVVESLEEPLLLNAVIHPHVTLLGSEAFFQACPVRVRLHQIRLLMVHWTYWQVLSTMAGRLQSMSGYWMDWSGLVQRLCSLFSALFHFA